MAVLLALAFTGAAWADSIFVSNSNSITIGEYTTSRATVNASLISGLNEPEFMTIVPSAPATTPEPSALALFATGLTGLGLIGIAARRRAAKAGLSFAANRRCP